MRRPTLNLVVDAASFAGFVFLVSTGVLVRYVLPPGSGKARLVWGLDRHDWGALHFWIATVFLGLLALHLVLHSKWIVSVLRGRPRQGSGSRLALGVVGLLAVLALAAAPLLAPVEQGDPSASTGNHGEQPALRGSMTLSEMERQTGVPTDHVLRELALPPDLSRDEPLGRLARQHGFEIGDVRRIVASYQPDD